MPTSSWGVNIPKKGKETREMTKKTVDAKAKRPVKKIPKKVSLLHKGSKKRPMDSGRFSRRVFDVALDGIAIVDEQGIYVDSNEAYCQMIGYSYGELIGMHAETLIVPEERHRLQHDFVPKMREAGKVRLDSAILHKEGRVIPIALSSVRFSYEGKPAFLSVIHDLSERKQNEEALRDSEERYRILTESVMDGVIVILDGKIKFVNMAMVSLFGYQSTNEILGKNLEVLNCPALREYFERDYETFVKGDAGESTFMAHCQTKGGREFWV